MKRWLLVLFLCNAALAQKITLTDPTVRDLAQGIPNQLLVMGANCRNLKVTTDNGVVTFDTARCQLSITPKDLGVAMITVTDRSGRAVARQGYQVKPIAFSVTMIGVEDSYMDTTRFLLAAHLDLNSRQDICISDWRVKFDLVVVAEPNRIFKDIDAPDGSLREIKQRIQPVKPGDILVFRNVRVLVGAYEILVPDFSVELK